MWILEAGDILFFKSSGSFLDRIIAWWTQSAYVHMAIVVSASEMIEALSSGIQKSPMRSGVLWKYREHTQNYDEKDLQNALDWLEGMVGKEYGHSDIVTAINPFRKFFYAVLPGRWDCSALTCEFLNIAGGIDLGQFEFDPHLATPGTLAKQLGV